jgi:hypothetical protein
VNLVIAINQRRIRRDEREHPALGDDDAGDSRLGESPRPFHYLSEATHHACARSNIKPNRITSAILIM